MIDTHSHIYTQEFDIDAAEAILRAQAAGVGKIILPGIDCSSVARALRMAAENPDCCYAAIGLHPTDVKENFRNDLQTLEKQLDTYEWVAIGETGLDLYWDKTFEKEQVEAFQTQIQWAVRKNLPLILHVREAFEQTMEVLKPFKNSGLQGVFHSFGGTLEQAQEIMDFGGFFIGINGIVTFKNSNLSAVLPHIPLQYIVTETDAPFLAPAPHRGQRNESAYIPLIVNKLAEIYQLPEIEIDRVTTQNAKNLFNI